MKLYHNNINVHLQSALGSSGVKVATELQDCYQLFLSSTEKMLQGAIGNFLLAILTVPRSVTAGKKQNSQTD